MKTFLGDPEELAKPERFFLDIIKVPGYQSRIKALIFREVYEEMLYEIDFKETNLKKALDKARQNNRIHTTLEVALALSNYLNGTTIKGGAWGFKVDTLERFEEVKSADGK